MQATDSVSLPTDILQHGRWLRRLARALVGDADVAEDLAQETIIAAVKNRETLRGPLRPWMRGILKNIVRQHHRSERRRSHYEGAAGETLSLVAGMPQAIELQRQLLDILDDLPEHFRSTLFLHFFHDLDAAEIARRDGIPPSTVRSRLSYGLAEMRKRLDERHEGRDTWMAVLMPFSVPPRGGLFRTSRLPRAGVGAAAALTIGVMAILLAERNPTQRAAGIVASMAYPQSSKPTIIVAKGAPSDNGGGAAPCDLTDVWSPAHPRLIVTPARLCDLRAERGNMRSVLGQILARLQGGVAANRPEVFGAERPTYARSSLALGAAFTYLVTGDRRYAQQAYEQIALNYATGEDEAMPHRGYALGRAWPGLALGLVYDWAFGGLELGQRAELEHWLDVALDAWPGTDSEQRLRKPWASSWVAACRGTELLQILARGRPPERRERLGIIKAVLGHHLTQSHGTLGMSAEGWKHTMMGGVTLLPALYALRGLGDHDLDEDLAAVPFWRGAMWLGAFSASEDGAWANEWLQTGVAGQRAASMGFASLLFPAVPAKNLGEYLFFYERSVGRSSALPVDRQYEPERAGLVWAALFSPAGIDPVEPGGTATADETQGAYFFRNRWRDGHDLQLSLSGDFRSFDRLPETATAFDLGVRAFGLAEIGSRLLVDGKSRQSSLDTGARDAFERHGRGGYVIVDGGSKYRALGLSSAKRHLLVDFAKMPNGLLFSTIDRLRAPGTHSYSVPFKLGDERGPRAVTVSPFEEMGRLGALVRAPNGAYLKIWVLSPPSARVEVAETLTIHTEAADTDLWLVMVAGKDEPPRAVQIKGSMLATSLTLDVGSVRFDPETERIKID